MLGSPTSVRRAAAALAAAGLLALTACSGGSDEPSTDASASASESSSPSPSSSASSSASPSAGEASTEQKPRPPKPPAAPKARDTAASRAAYARFVIATWTYALRTDKATAVTDLSAKGKSCVGCAPFAKELAKRKKQGWYVDLPRVPVKKLTLKPGTVPGVYVATATVDIPASRSLFEDGSFRNDNEAHAETPFYVTMRLDGKRYTLLAFQVG